MRKLYRVFQRIFLFQLFRINTKGQIGVGERCIESPNGNTLHVAYCDVQPVGPWDYDEVNQDHVGFIIMYIIRLNSAS